MAAVIGSDVRSYRARDELAKAWRSKRGRTLSQTRGDYTLVIDEQPGLILNNSRKVVGIDFMVRLFDKAGAEIPIDPHRIFVNPPLQVVTKRAKRRPEDLEVIEPRELEYNPVEAAWNYLWEGIQENPAPQGWRTKGTVTTIFATAPGGDGYVRNIGTTYSTTRDGSGGSKSTGGNHQVGQLYEAAIVSYHVIQSHVIFDTSSIPDADSVTDVALSMDGDTDLSLNADFTVVAAASSYNGGAVITSDYVDGSTFSGLTELATWATTGYSSGYNAFTSAGAAFNSAINKTGNTALILYSSRTRDNTAPTSGGSNFNERVIFTDADAAGTTTDPKLVITHSTPAVVKVFNDTVQVSDLDRSILGKLLRVAETVQISDAFRSAMSLKRLFNETVQVSESILRSMSLRRIFNETVQVSDSIRRTLSLKRALGDTVQISESSSRLSGLKRILGETVQISDSVLNRLSLKRLFGETVQISETNSRRMSMVRRLAETVQLSESLITVRALVRRVAETVQISEVVNKVFSIRRIFNETVQVAESLRSLRAIVKLFNDSVQATENLLRRITMLRTFTETVQISEIRRNTLSLVRRFNEVVQVSEGRIFNKRLLIVISETVRVVEVRVIDLWPTLRRQVARISRSMKTATIKSRNYVARISRSRKDIQ